MRSSVVSAALSRRALSVAKRTVYASRIRDASARGSATRVTSAWVIATDDTVGGDFAGAAGALFIGSAGAAASPNAAGARRKSIIARSAAPNVRHAPKIALARTNE